MDKTIWGRRVAVDREMRTEVAAALGSINAKYQPIYAAIQEECELIGHEPRFSFSNVGGDAMYRCSLCGKACPEGTA